MKAQTRTPAVCRHVERWFRWRSRSGLVSRLCADNRSREIIPCHCIQSSRNQLIRFRHVTLALGFDPLGFLNILDRKLAQVLGLSIVGSRIIGGQQIPGAIASAVTSHAYHERLLNSSVSPFERTPRNRVRRTAALRMADMSPVCAKLCLS